ncbi:MAG TPA: peptidase dimerization domain-containing protein, partial [bacterium]|nr:peptidase dimerization domain-containing protein [bacterium]
ASPTSEDLELIRDLSSQFDSSLWQQTHAIRRWADDLSGQELLMRFMFSPTLNIQGIWGGHTGAGSKTVLPHKGVCQIDVRLVPGMTVEEVHEKLRAHLDRHGYGDIAILPLGGYPPARTSLKTKLVQAVVQMYRDHDITPQIWPLSGGSWPMYLYCEKPLRLPYCAGGLGHGGGAHSPDEYLVIEGNGAVAGLVEAEKSYVDILYNFMDA